MGAETSSLSSQHLEDGAPLQPQLPKHESHGDGDIHEVVDRVFVSGLAGALNFPMLHQRGVTHVLNASHYDDCPHAYRMHEFSYMMLNLPESDKDGRGVDMRSQTSNFHRSNQFMVEGRRNGGVLVHCRAGTSLAPALVAAFLVGKKGLSVSEAISSVAQAHPATVVDPMVICQLLNYEESLTNTDMPSTPSRRAPHPPEMLSDRLGMPREPRLAFGSGSATPSRSASSRLDLDGPAHSGEARQASAGSVARSTSEAGSARGAAGRDPRARALSKDLPLARHRWEPGEEALVVGGGEDACDEWSDSELRSDEDFWDTHASRRYEHLSKTGEWEEHDYWERADPEGTSLLGAQKEQDATPPPRHHLPLPPPRQHPFSAPPPAAAGGSRPAEEDGGGQEGEDEEDEEGISYWTRGQQAPHGNVSLDASSETLSSSPAWRSGPVASVRIHC